MDRRAAARRLIQDNIDRTGVHIYVVSGPWLPRYLYTIGWLQPLGAELVLAGAIDYEKAEALDLIQRCAEHGPFVAGRTLRLGHLGEVGLRTVDPTWVRHLLHGAIDHHGTPDVPALQLCVSPDRWTLDTPDLSRPYDPALEPAWSGLHTPLAPPLLRVARALTDGSALRGSPILRATRWEEAYWELFCEDVPDRARLREVPLATLLAVDPSLGPVLDLAVGAALWRAEGGAAWQPRE